MGAATDTHANNQQASQCTSINISSSSTDPHRIHTERERSNQQALRFTHKLNVRTVYGRVLYDGDGRDGGMQTTHTHTSFVCMNNIRV